MIFIENLKFSYRNTFSFKLKSLKVEDGKNLVITGDSGRGKSTFLKLLSGQLTAASGKISVMENDLDSMSDSQLRKFRLKNLGLIFQDSPLLDYLNLKDNITLLPGARIRSEKITEITAKMVIEKLLLRFPHEISEGEKQRAGICRALAASPKVILADEPTGSLDPEMGLEVTQALIQHCREINGILIMDCNFIKNVPSFYV